MSEKKIQLDIHSQVLKKKLAGIMPMSSGSTYPFTPEHILCDNEIPQEYKPIFHIRQFTNEESKTVQKAIIKIVDAIKKEHAIIKGKKGKSINSRGEYLSEKEEDNYNELSRQIIMDWENLYDLGTGDIILFNKDRRDLIKGSMLTLIMQEGIKITGIIPAGIGL